MRLLILGDPKSSHVVQLRQAAEPNHDVVIAAWSELSGVVGCQGDRPGVRLGGGLCSEQLDVALVRAMPHGSLEQVITTMNLISQMHDSGVRVINPPRALESAIDKYLTTVMLQSAGLVVPRTYVCQSSDDAMTAFEALDRDVVIKPLFGGEGRGVMRIQDTEVLERVARSLLRLGAILYLQAFVPNQGWDIRLMVVGDRVWAIRRDCRGDWRTNLAKGAIPQPVELTSELADIGRRAAKAVGCVVAGVDILPGSDSQHYVLEVNAVPGWSGLARTLNVNIAEQIVDFVNRTEST